MAVIMVAATDQERTTVTPSNPFLSSAAVFAAGAAAGAPLATPAAHDELTLDMGPRRWRVRHIAEEPLSGQPAGQRHGVFG